jgi:hypothetical protein
MKWKGIWDIHILSTGHSNKMIDALTSRELHRRAALSLVMEYSKYGIGNKSDQLLAFYSSQRKSVEL